MSLEDPLQWVVIAVVVIVFLMWGPKKIPELARSIGLARKEFNNASKAPLDTVLSVAQALPTPSPAATGDALLDTAKKMGIVTEGKTRDEVSKEIFQRAR